MFGGEAFADLERVLVTLFVLAVIGVIGILTAVGFLIYWLTCHVTLTWS